jgi:radical SAM protein with 4Fe4S-binding SPASM domain
MCPNKDLKKEEKGFMEPALFRKIIDEARGFVFDANLIHRGEGLLHPDFLSLAEYAHAAGIYTKFHTNATLLDENLSRRLIRSGLDQISFSFDGFDKETYESIRVNADFEKTLGNIVRFLEIKKELGSRKPHAVFEIIHFPHLVKDAAGGRRREFLKKFRGLPLDRLEIKEMHNWAGEVARAPAGKKYAPCTFLWQALVIFWNGSVLPCTQDFHGAYPLGNVRDDSLARIWNNDRMVRLRENILRRDIAGLEACSQCDRLWRGQFLGVPREYLWKFLFRRMP